MHPEEQTAYNGPEQTPSSLEEQRRRLDSILLGVEKAAESLEKALGDVLRPSVPTAEAIQELKPVAPVEGLLAGELRSFADRTNSLQMHLRELVDRIELGS